MNEDLICEQLYYNSINDHMADYEYNASLL